MLHPEKKDVKTDLSENETTKWQKISSISTLLTLITSSLIGLYGIYLGSSAIETAVRFESFKLRPLFVFQYNSYMAPGARISFLNIGYGPGKVLAVSSFYESLSGHRVWLSYGNNASEFRNRENLNM